MQKLENWKQTAEQENCAIFETFSSVIEGNLDINLSLEILQHLVNLWRKFLTYFPEISAVDLELVRKSFVIPIEKVTDDLQGELIDFRNGSACKDMFEIYQSASFLQGCVFLTCVSKRMHQSAVAFQHYVFM